MATANELLRDALVRRQINLARYETQLVQEILALLDATEFNVRMELTRRLELLLADEGFQAFGPSTNARLEVLAAAIKSLRGGALNEASDRLHGDFDQLTHGEVAFIDSAMKQVSPVVLDTIVPDTLLLAAIVTSQPVQGRTLAQWFDGITEADTTRIMDAVSIGMTRGLSVEQIVREVFGTSQMNGSDGVVETTRLNIQALVQTSISTIANEARSAFYDANSDIISEVMWVATLDPITCEECAGLDGQRYPVGEAPEPPAHFRCRCVLVPVIDGMELGDRPAVTATEAQLEGLSPDERAEAINGMVGRVPASLNYQDWLSGQAASFQDEVLGPARGKLFRDGMTLRRFTTPSGRLLTLDQLAQQD